MSFKILAKGSQALYVLYQPHPVFEEVKFRSTMSNKTYSYLPSNMLKTGHNIM